MSTYLDLCNKVIQESSNELNELTLATWSSPEAGRRVYPRIKRLVAEAWKMLQMERDEWEFKSAERSFYVEPKMKLTDGTGTPLVPSAQLKNMRTQDILNVVAVETTGGDMTLGTWTGQVTFEPTGSVTLFPFEIQDLFEVVGDPTTTFRYDRAGSYNFQIDDPLMREIQWTTFVGRSTKVSPTPIYYIPWSNWLMLDADFSVSYRTLPQYVSQDYQGNLVFYPQTVDPFYVSFTYDTAPQEFSDPEDVPALLKEEYHDWIAWKALGLLASYDKNATLLAWTTKMEKFYRQRAEKELMPIPVWGDSQFNVNTL